MTNTTLTRQAKKEARTVNGINFTFTLYKGPLALSIKSDFPPFWWDDLTSPKTLQDTLTEYGFDSKFADALGKEQYFFRLEEVMNDGNLFIINRNLEHCSYVVCYNFNGREWDWGTYCDTLEEAMEIFKSKKGC